MRQTAIAVTAIDNAKRRAADERRRAEVDATAAARHEFLAASGPEILRGFHLDAANVHRRLEARHIATAALQASLACTPTAARISAGAVGRATPIRDEQVQAGDPGPETALDDRTDLPDRYVFIERMRAAIDWLTNPAPPGTSATRSARRLGVCHIGLDEFESVTERFGRDVGDSLVVAVAHRVTEHFPGYLLARLADGELAVLVPDTSCAGDATNVADAVLAAIRKPFYVRGHVLSVSARIGVVERSAARAEPTEIMGAAAVMLHLAKASDRVGWELFEPERTGREEAGHRLAVALPAAILGNELFVEYQPIVSLHDEKVVAAEALVRWRHPEFGVLYPDQFIDIAERSGAITSLGAFVLDRACRDAAEWGRLTSVPPSVSVNVAARQLRGAGLYTDVTNALDRSGLPATRLILEITESAAVSPYGDSVSVLRALAGRGIRIAIDDFGVGYSNLAQLRRLPAHLLKVDRSLVFDSGPANEGDPTDECILAAVVSLGHVLGLSVIAEGVETAAQTALLRLSDCDFAQGWHYGRPVSHEVFARLITDTAGEPEPTPPREPSGADLRKDTGAGP